MTENERRELRVLGSNIRDDRTRGLIFKACDELERLLELEQPKAEHVEPVADTEPPKAATTKRR